MVVMLVVMRLEVVIFVVLMLMVVMLMVVMLMVVMLMVVMLVMVMMTRTRSVISLEVGGRPSNHRQQVKSTSNISMQPDCYQWRAL